MRLVIVVEDKTVHTSRLGGTLGAASCSRARDCHCGQQLDLHVRPNCPRCGRAVARS